MKKYILLVVSILLTQIEIQAQTNQDITVNGTNRSMSVYDPGELPENAPLMITMHGMNQDVPYHISNSEWEEVADTAKLLVVYPQGIDNSWDISGTRDTDFILAIIDAMADQYGIDRNRVYLSGFSMGGMMTYHAATIIADQIAAFAPVSGYLMGGPNTNSSRPIPIIHTHGTTDDVVTYDGVQTCIDAWVDRNNCQTPAVVTDPYPSSKPNSSATKSYWGPGDDGVEIVLMTLEGKGHWWSEDLAGSIHTSSEIWKFVRKYSLNSGEPILSFTSPTTQTFVAPATITFDVNASDEDGTISHIQYYINDELIEEKSAPPYSFEYTLENAGEYTVQAIATDNENNSSEKTISLLVHPPQTPYEGTPNSIPGTIECEHFDVGGNGYAYSDVDAGTNVEDPAPDFRTDEDVDIETCTDDGGGYNIGYAMAGEWLEYTVDVQTTGMYDITFRVACEGDDRTVSLESDNTMLAENIAIPNTGDWQTWTDVIVENIELQAGEQVLRLTIGDVDYVNLNYMTFTPISVGPTVSISSPTNNSEFNTSQTIT
ncbi:MAG: carbohydrate-binding protein, partial [Bacteroidales bacterium]